MSSTEFTSNRDNCCYRHPDRQSFVLCQRCLRTVCHECQTQAAVGVICPECMKAERKNRTPAQKRAQRRWGLRSAGAARSVVLADAGAPIMTYAIIGITAFVGMLQLIPGFGGLVTNALAFFAPYLYPHLTLYPFEPWRLLTSVLVHGSFWHLALNMLALWMIGRTLEPMLGRWRFLVLYVLGGIGGSVAVACLAPGSATIGASGAVFAMFGALLIIGRHIGADVTGIIVVLGINLVIGFLPGVGISWQAHIGGAVAGALVALVYTRTRRRDQRVWQILLLVAIVLVFVVLLATVPPAVMFG